MKLAEILKHQKRLAYQHTLSATISRPFTRWQLFKWALRALFSPRQSYQFTLLGGNGLPHAFAAEVLADLKRFCGINKGGLVVSPVGRVVDPYATIYRAAQRDVYLRIIQFLELEEESDYAGRATTD